jgi:hypothetical protein
MKKAFTMAIAAAGLWLPATSAGQTAAATARAHHAAGAQQHAGPEHQAAGRRHHQAGGTTHHAAGTEHQAVIAQHHDAVTQQSSGTRRLMAGLVETRITPGRPYSAEAVTETVQVLGDGNRIDRRSATKVYRDGEGRTRREVLAEDGSVRSITISDSVAHMSYTLDPKTKIAYKAGGSIIFPMPVRSPSSGTYTYTLQRSDEGHATAKLAETRATTARAGGSGTGGVKTRRDAPDPNVTREDLGPQNIEGVMATGTRTTTVIPAGEIGNALEIRIVSEQWFSDELQLLVMTRHSDPRSGETTYRLRDILRVEPDQSFFTVPPDYTIQQGGIRQPE